MAVMDESMDGINSRSKGNVPLGVNKQSSKIGKGVKRSVIQHSNKQHQQPQQQPPPVYNINKNDFRNVVQRLTGSPLPEPYQPPPPPPPPNPNPKPSNSRLQRIRPPPLNSIASNPAMPSPFQRPFGNSPLGASSFFSPLPPLTPGDAVWANNTAESPVSAYMRYLQQSMSNPGSRNASPRGSAPVAHSPGSHRPPLLPTPPMLPSPRANLPPLLPSPTGQFLLPSPLPSPGSLMPLPSPGSPFLFNNFFSQSPSAQFGFPGGGPMLSLPPSPGFLFPLSPAGRFPVPSPRWRDAGLANFGVEDGSSANEDFSFPDRNHV